MGLFAIVASPANDHISGMEKEKLWYFEDARLGQTFASGPVTVTQDDIIAYARQFDPQTFHTDPAAAVHTPFGELVASGWHTASLTMRLMTKALPRMDGGMIGRRVESMDWPRPVKPNDTLRIESEVLHLRTTANPARGLMRLRTRTINQKNEDVMVMEALIFIPRKPAT